jgi:hypothetical protein
MPSRKPSTVPAAAARLDARDHRGEVADREIGALVGVAGKLAAGIVVRARPGVMVDVAQHPAVDAGLAVDRQQETLHLGLRRGDGPSQKHERQNPHLDSLPCQNGNSRDLRIAQILNHKMNSPMKQSQSRPISCLQIDTP